MDSLDEALETARVAERYLRCPFLDPDFRVEPNPAGEYNEAWKQLRRLASDDGTGVVNQLIAAKRYREARRVIVALVQANARRYDADNPAMLFPETTYAAVELSATAVAAVVAAHQRCMRELWLFAGNSGVAREIRAAVWRTCFGESLYDAVRDSQRTRGVVRSTNVLVLGETGTGKEILARAIQGGAIGDSHRMPPTASVNIAAIPTSLLESELFGHVKGAFSGATADRVGRLEEVHGGTLFLDEVADIPPETQPKFLRALQERKVMRLGANKEVPADVRIVAATSQPLHELVEAKKFRRDLYERLCGIEVRVPPLRERREDIKEIADAIANSMVGSPRKDPVSEVSTGIPGDEERAEGAVAEVLKVESDWPGNVRELENWLRARILGFSAARQNAATASEHGLDPFMDRVSACEVSLEELTDWYANRVLTHSGGNQTKAATILGIDRNTLARMLKRNTST